MRRYAIPLKSLIDLLIHSDRSPGNMCGDIFQGCEEVHKTRREFIGIFTVNEDSRFSMDSHT